MRELIFSMSILRGSALITVSQVYQGLPMAKSFFQKAADLDSCLSFDNDANIQYHLLDNPDATALGMPPNIACCQVCNKDISVGKLGVYEFKYSEIGRIMDSKCISIVCSKQCGQVYIICPLGSENN